MLKVSVILPVYKGAQTLSQTLESLAAQTFNDFELIACIDGSTDGSEAIIERYASHFKKVLILRNASNRGLGCTMNRLVFNTSCPYIAIAEQDDYYYPERLQQQLEVLEKDNTVGLVSGIAEFWNGEQVVGQFPGMLVRGESYPTGKDMFLLNYKKHLKVVNSCIMFRKSVHIEHGLYFSQHYPSVSVDWSYVLRFSLISKIHGLNKVLVRLDRRVDRNSVTSDKSRQHKAARELLRSFAYEYPEIIDKRTYKHALNTQLMMEVNAKSGFQYLRSWLFHFIQCRNEKNYIRSFKKRIAVKFSNK